jgi:hypothetical protein
MKTFKISICAKVDEELHRVYPEYSPCLVVMDWVQFEQDVEMGFASEVHDLRQVNAEHGSFVEIILGENAEL